MNVFQPGTEGPPGYSADVSAVADGGKKSKKEKEEEKKRKKEEEKRKKEEEKERKRLEKELEKQRKKVSIHVHIVEFLSHQNIQISYTCLL